MARINEIEVILLRNREEMERYGKKEVLRCLEGEKNWNIRKLG
jgi:hypothetical protein